MSQELYGETPVSEVDTSLMEVKATVTIVTTNRELLYRTLEKIRFLLIPLMESPNRISEFSIKIGGE